MVPIFRNRIIALGLSLVLAGCASSSKNPVESKPLSRQEKSQAAYKLRYDAAQKLFQQTVKNCHLPSVDLKGAQREDMMEKAARGYQQVLRKYPEQNSVCAQALRSLANIRVEQTRTNEAIRLYTQVGKQYPQESWEVIQAWKSASDLLWQNNQASEAAVFDLQIINTFDQPEMPSVIQTIVRAVKKREQSHPIKL
jgi:tetratricopeptide (TPR) repeat protein